MAKAKVKLDSTTQKATLKKVMQCISRYRFLVVLSILLAAISVALTLYVPILVGDAIDFIVAAGQVELRSNNDHADARGHCGGHHSAGAVADEHHQQQDHLSGHPRYARSSAFRKIQVLPLKYIDSHPYGEVVSRVIADVDQFADGLLMGFTQLFTGVITILGTLAFMLTVNVGITLVVVLLTPLSLFVASFIARRTFSHVQTTVRGACRADRAGGRNGRQPEGRAGLYAMRPPHRKPFDEINERLRASSLQAQSSSPPSPTPPRASSTAWSMPACGADGRAGCGFRRRSTVGGLSCLSELRQPIYQALQRDLRRHHGAAKRTGLRRASV